MNLKYYHIDSIPDAWIDFFEKRGSYWELRNTVNRKSDAIPFGADELYNIEDSTQDGWVHLTLKPEYDSSLEAIDITNRMIQDEWETDTHLNEDVTFFDWNNSHGVNSLS